MAKYRLSNVAKEDLIRIHQYGVEKYYNSFFAYFDIIAQRPFSFESIEYIRNGYRRCASGADNIYFRIKNGTVEIMAIVGRQDLTKILKSL